MLCCLFFLCIYPYSNSIRDKYFYRIRPSLQSMMIRESSPNLPPTTLQKTRRRKNLVKLRPRYLVIKILQELSRQERLRLLPSRSKTIQMPFKLSLLVRNFSSSIFFNRCCTVPRKILILQKSFATQHSFATKSVQLRYKGLLLMMVVFDHGHFS